MSLTLTPRSPGALTTNALIPGSLVLQLNPPGLIWSDAMSMSNAMLIDDGVGVVPTIPLAGLSPGTLVLT